MRKNWLPSFILSWFDAELLNCGTKYSRKKRIYSRQKQAPNNKFTVFFFCSPLAQRYIRRGCIPHGVRFMLFRGGESQNVRAFWRSATVFCFSCSHKGTFVDDVSPIWCHSCCSVRWLSKIPSFLKIGNSFSHSLLNLLSLTKYMYGFHNGAVLARTTGTDDRARCIVLFLVMMTYIANAAYGLQDNRNATVKFILK